MMKKDVNLGRCQYLCKNILALYAQIDELRQFANYVGRSSIGQTVEATIERIQKDKKDVQTELVMKLKKYNDSDRDGDIKNVKFDDLNNEDGPDMDRKKIKEIKMKLDSINLQGNDDKPPEIKSQRIEEKKTAIQWLKETSNSNEIEKYALELTAQLSLTVVDLLVIMQERKDLKQQFQQFKSKVELLMIDDDCFVSRHILNLLEIAETELKGTKKSINELAGMEDDSDRYESSHEEEIVGDVFEECWLEIESLGKTCQTPCPRPKGPLKSANEVSLPLENKLKELQQDIKELSKKVSELKGTFPSTKENKVPVEFWKNIRWISRDQTWNQFGEVRSSE